MITTAHGLEIAFDGCLDSPGHPPESELTIYSITVVDADEVMDLFGRPSETAAQIVEALEREPGLTDEELDKRFGPAWSNGTTYSLQEWKDRVGTLCDIEDICFDALRDLHDARLEHRSGADY